MKINSHPSLHTGSSRSPLKLGLCIAALFAATAVTQSANLINDTWKDGTRTDPAGPVYSENGTDGDADGNLESAWFYENSGGGTMTIVDDDTPGGDQMLRTLIGGTSSASWTTYFTPSNSTPLTLSAIGDVVKVTWVFMPTNVGPANTSQGLRVAIVDTPEPNRITAGAPGTAAYQGYAMFMNMGTPTLGGSAFQLKERTDPLTASAFLSASGSWTTIGNGSPLTGEGYLDGSTYTFVMQFTLQSGGAVEIVSTMAGANIGGTGLITLTNVDATPNSLTFDTHGVRPGNSATSATNFYTKLFKVEFIPGGACTPTAYNVTGSATVCSGGTSSVGLSDSDSGVDYHLLQGGVPTGTVLGGTGSALDYGLQGVGTYTVYASNTTIACEGLMAGSAVIAQYANPVVTVNPTPSTALNAIGDTRAFSITATGPGLTYQWRKDAVNLSNTGNISGANTATLTITNLALSDSGAYDCVVSNSPCGAFTDSADATLTVSAGSGILFRSVNTGSGNWSDTLTWEQSTDGTVWNPASAAPTSLDSNIVVRAGHAVVVDTDQTADEMTIEATGTVSVQGGSLIINNGVGAGFDLSVLGTLEVGAGAGNIVQSSASIQVGNGGQFNWNRAAAPAIPTATWQDGSTCRITTINTGSSALASGVGGQSYYDFIYDTTAGGQVASARCRLNMQGNTEVRRDFTIKIPDVASASVTLHNAANSVLTVGRHVTFQSGTTSGNGNKVLLANAAVTGLGIKIGGNFTVTGYLDGFGSASTLIEFNGVGAQTLSLPIQPNMLTTTAMNWLVNSGSTLAFASQIDGFNTFTNKGTLNFGANRITLGTTLVFDPGCTVNGDGTNLLVSGINDLVSGGSLNLGALPVFAGGESFQLFSAAVSYNGSFGTLLPTVPDGTHTWVTTQLNTAGILAVSGGVNPNPTNITSSVSGSTLTLAWPASHLGWTLQTQTNTRSVGITMPTNTWFDVSGSAATNQVDITINKDDPTVFFRLRLPQP